MSIPAPSSTRPPQQKPSSTPGFLRGRSLCIKLNQCMDSKKYEKRH